MTEYEMNMRRLCATLNEELVASPSHSPLVSNDNEEGAESTGSLSISISSSAEATASLAPSGPDDDDAQSTASASPSRPPDDDVEPGQTFNIYDSVSSAVPAVTRSMGDFGRQLHQLGEMLAPRMVDAGFANNSQSAKGSFADAVDELRELDARATAAKQADREQRIEEAGRPATRSKAIELDPDT